MPNRRWWWLATTTLATAAHAVPQWGDTTAVALPDNFAAHKTLVAAGGCPVESTEEQAAEGPTWTAIDVARTSSNTLLVLAGRYLRTTADATTYQNDMRRVVAFGYNNGALPLDAASCGQSASVDVDRILVSPSTIYSHDRSDHCRFYVLVASGQIGPSLDQVRYIKYKKGLTSPEVADRFEAAASAANTHTCSIPTPEPAYEKNYSSMQRVYTFTGESENSRVVLITSIETPELTIRFRATLFEPSETGCIATRWAGNAKMQNMDLGVFVQPKGVPAFVRPLHYKLRAAPYGPKGVQVWLECTRESLAKTDCSQTLYGAVVRTIPSAPQNSATSLLYTIDVFDTEKKNRFVANVVEQAIAYPTSSATNKPVPIEHGLSVYLAGNTLTPNAGTEIRGTLPYAPNAVQGCSWLYTPAMFPAAGALAPNCNQLHVPDVPSIEGCEPLYRHRAGGGSVLRDGGLKCWPAQSTLTPYWPVTELDLYRAFDGPNPNPTTTPTPPPPGATTTTTTTTTTTVVTPAPTDPPITNPPGDKPTTTEPTPPCAADCELGHGCYDGECVACPVGTYRSEAGNGPCIDCSQKACPVGMITLQSCIDGTESGLLSQSPPICGRPGAGHCTNGQVVNSDVDSADNLWHWECIEPTSYPCPKASATIGQSRLFGDDQWYIFYDNRTYLLPGLGTVSLFLLDQHGGLPETDFLPIMVLKCVDPPAANSTTTTTLPAATPPSGGTANPGDPTPTNYKHLWKVARSNVWHAWLITTTSAAAVGMFAAVTLVKLGYLQLPHLTSLLPSKTTGAASAAAGTTQYKAVGNTNYY